MISVTSDGLNRRWCEATGQLKWVSDLKI
jgi:hypothetical protein